MSLQNALLTTHAQNIFQSVQTKYLRNFFMPKTFVGWNTK